MKKIGRYELIEVLGHGAMGTVYKASDPTIDRQVALKVLSLLPSVGRDSENAHQTLMREARAAGRLAHPSIVTIFDAFEDPETKSSCIVMELIQGQTLEKILLSGPALTTEKALDVIHQVAEALDYAHQQQVIHRDLKPANIILGDDGKAKITDFGIAKIAAGEGTVRTVSIMGTPAYMSPEQISGKELDPRSDLFSLGIVMYLTLTGERPFAGDTAAVMFKIVYEDPIRPSKLNPKLTPGHDHLILRCLAKNREERYPSARDFLDDLDDLQQGRPPGSQADSPVTAPSTLDPTVKIRPAFTSSAPRKAWAFTEKSKRIILGVGIAVLALAAGLGFWELYWRKQTRPPSPSPSAQISPPPLPAQTSGGSQAASESASVKAPSAEPPAKETVAGPEALTPKSKSRSSKNSPAVGKDKASTTEGTPAPEPTKPATAIAPEAAAATPTRAEPAAAKPTSAAKIVQLSCVHQIKEATLTVSSGGQVIFHRDLRARKKGGVLGIKATLWGVVSGPMTIPAGAQDISVRVVSKDGSVDVSRNIPGTPPSGPSPTLHIEVKADSLMVHW